VENIFNVSASKLNLYPSAHDVETISNDSELVVNFFDDFNEPLVSIRSNYGGTVRIFCFDTHLNIEEVLPHVASFNRCEDINLTHVLCLVPEGENFFEADFSEFNRCLGLPDTKDFIFKLGEG